MKSNLKIKFLILALIGVFFVTSGLGCKGGSTAAQTAAQPKTLTIWRVYDGQDTFADIIATYQAMHPNITVNYRELRYEEYEDELLRAFAEDRSPDIFSIRNTWVNNYAQWIRPMPAQVTVPYQIETGTLKKELIWQLQTTTAPTADQIKEKFVPVVAGDVLLGGNVWALPMSVDTLVLYYNRGILDSAGVPEPPKNWEELLSTIKQVTLFDKDGKILVAGAALGGGANVERSPDILSLIMMQNGVTMANAAGTPTFAAGTDKNQPSPALEALTFYTDFANPVRDIYTWNATLPNSATAFLRGQAAFFFGYAYHLPQLQAAGARLNFGVLPFPQISGNSKPINYANYWVETVSKKTKNINEAWDFVLFATSEQNVVSYLKKANKPTALRSLIKAQSGDKLLAPFVGQLLTAQSWYHGNNAVKVDDIFIKMIDTVVKGQVPADVALGQAAREIGN